MPPIAVNRRRFLGCSAAASLALSHGAVAEAEAIAANAKPVRLGLVGIGNRGTARLACAPRTTGRASRRAL